MIVLYIDDMLVYMVHTSSSHCLFSSHFIILDKLTVQLILYLQLSMAKQQMLSLVKVILESLIM